MRDRTDTPPPVVAGMTDEQLAHDARALLLNADRAEADASAWKWAAADRIAALRERGWTLARIAEALGIARSTVTLYEACVKAFPRRAVRPRFAEAQYSARPGLAPERNQANTAGRVLRTAPAEVVERIVAELPPARQRVVARAGEEAVRDTLRRDAREDAGRRREEDPERQAERERDAAEGLLLDIRDTIFRARRNLARAIPEIRYAHTSGAFTVASEDDLPGQIRRELGRLRATADLIGEALEATTAPDDIDAELARLLEDGEAAS